ncbi:hypothetical protein MSAS_43550 [Mycobacterium saskatchewanense]|nr:hypothetical protein MSAS_43550 [Mycobacterium saskatchewanense]
MDAAGIVHQVLSPIPPMICDWAAAGPATEWAERINAAVADIVSAHPRRFSGLGTVPLHHPDAAVAVLHRAHQAGLSGVEIGTTAGSRELDHLDLREFFCAAEELEMLIFVHPLILGTRSQWTDRIVGAAATFGLSMGTDTAIAATRLAFGGVTRKCPGLRICLAHGGGTFFWALPRISRLWDATNDATAADLVQNIYADTVVYRDANLHFLRSQLGPHRMVFGTDYPLPAHDDLSGSMLSGLGLTDARLVGTDTAARLLNVPIGH